MLSIAIFLPIISALLLMPTRFSNHKHYYFFGIIISLINYFVSIKILLNFDITNNNFQFVENVNLVQKYGISYFLGIDGISLLMILLTTILTPICFIISFDKIKNRIKEFVIAFLLIEGFVIGSFSSLDLLLFYFFFEAILIPMFMIIGIWGSDKRIYAAYKFFLFTLFGSLFFLIAIIFIINQLKTSNIIELRYLMPMLISSNISDIDKILWLAFFISFAIKVPMFPVHSWLPDAHVQAPTSGSVILAAILIKLGAYGFLRFSLPLFPDASVFFSEMVFYLSVTAIIYGSLVALVQEDMKKMIAYSSIAHMGFVTMGIFTFNKQGIDGAIMQMISHGIISAALFISVGVIYDRLHSKQIKDMGGIANKMPNFAVLAMIFTMGSVGLPGTSGFVGEFLTIIGVFKVNKIVAIIAGLGVVFGACYMLWLYKKVWFSDVSNVAISKFKDLDVSEFYPLLLLAFLTIIFGLFPNLIFQYFDLSSNLIVDIFNQNQINCIK
jgi:NADH-quinone oxidoreductase subunit M